MKNAMKRIMGLLLVAVLLVSVVPFQALAAEISGGNDYKGFQYIAAHFGDEVKTAAWQEGPNDPQTKTIKDILDHFWSGWSSNYRFRDASYAGQTGITDINTVLHSNFDNTSVVINLYGIPQFKVSVAYKLEDSGADRGSAEFTRKDGQSVSFDEIVKAAPEKDAYKVTRVAFGNSEIRSGSITVNDNLWVTAYMEGIGGNSGNNNQGSDNTQTTKKVTAVYSVDGVDKGTKEYDVNGKTVAELMEMGGFSTGSYNLSKAGLGGSGDAKGLNDVIYRGEKVYIKMTAKSGTTTPTTPSAKKDITVEVKVDRSSNTVATFTKTPNGDTAKVGDLLTYGWRENWKNSYDFDHAYCNKTTLYSLNDTVRAGDTVSVLLKTKNSSSSTTTNKFPYEVVLNVYLDTKVGEPDRRINISTKDTSTYLTSDGVVSLEEVQNLLSDKYYKAKNSRGIEYDGLYLARGNWVEKWSKDYDKYSQINNINDMRSESRVDINVMLTNATRKSSSTADSSNPKTGDAIFMTITVMGLSTAGLTALYFYDKKRKAL